MNFLFFMNWLHSKQTKSEPGITVKLVYKDETFYEKSFFAMDGDRIILHIEDSLIDLLAKRKKLQEEI